MSIYRYAKTVTPPKTAFITFEDSDDEESHSYNVLFDYRPPSKVQLGEVHTGDVYVQLQNGSSSHSIHLWTSDDTKWVQWNPETVLSVDVLGVLLYTIHLPCKACSTSQRSRKPLMFW